MPDHIRLDTDTAEGQEQNVLISLPATKPEVSEECGKTEGNEERLLYPIRSVPAIPTTLIFALQQSVMCITCSVSVPLIVVKLICAVDNQEVRTELFSATIFACGVATLLQCGVGVRLPIIQGSSFSFIAPLIAMLTIEGTKCDDENIIKDGSSAYFNITPNGTDAMDREAIWQGKLNEVQGSLMVASLVQVILGGTGAIGVLMNYIGPLTIAPTVAMIGLSVFDMCADYGSVHWGIWILSLAVGFICAVYMRNVKVPFLWWNRESGCHKTSCQIFVLIPAIFMIVIAWIVSLILTLTGALPDDPGHPQYKARTDAYVGGIHTAKWFFVPYPGKYGPPTVTVGGVIGMIAATIASTIESIGDYHACASVCEVPSPPSHAVNRGILMEGIGSIIAASVGTGHGTTSYSQCIGAIGITKVGSLRVFQTAGILMIVLGVIGKFGATLAAIPDPIQGAIITLGIAMVVSVGLSNLEFIDMRSSRNMAILGTALMCGLLVPYWMKKNPTAVRTGVNEIDQLFTVFLTTPMFISGLLGFFLDNTVPATVEERGIKRWKESLSGKSTAILQGSMKDYDIPFVSDWMRKIKCFKLVPCLPPYQERTLQACGKVLRRNKNKRNK
ncbi:solute carrier family 23 member 2 [Lingula anatina]|uniref:Solute carrier family 23 member 2 n=1 Tax=Lingula anatina TaxID=7574 RepID=A0A1S3H1X4_LINAN|nr:solute carrier family 23 member 2 [Lingula anatina]|eukprot:XP_013379942.1 solute carrier family 23 member 2 [Lingula anatina]